MSDSANEVSSDSTDTPTIGQEEKRDRSTIGCPYLHLEGSMAMAVEVHNLGIDSCEWNQLATATGQSPGGGSFRQKMISARMFGLLTYGDQKVELTELGRKAVDPKSQREVKVDAFLSVQLFAQAFEHLERGPLPPHVAIQHRMIELGVAPKRAEKARQVFLRSAKHAGFFEISPSRMARPRIASPQEPEAPIGNQDPPADNRLGGGGPPKQPPRHPLIDALLDQMEPTGQEWEKSHCATWLRTFLLSISMLYSNREELQQIQISVSDAPGRTFTDSSAPNRREECP